MQYRISTGPSDKINVDVTLWYTFIDTDHRGPTPDNHHL